MSSTSIADSGTPIGRGLPRFVDFGLAGLGLLVTSPLLVLIAVVIKLGSPGPVLFRQIRIGKAGQAFTLLKFRSMRTQTEGPPITAAGDPRVTPAGRFLRWSKLDELPSLWNIVRGDMALVGPRPEVPRYVDLEDPRWRRVLSVRPGLTDPVTLKLRYEERLLGEVEDPDVFYSEVLQPYKLGAYETYLETRSIGGDIQLLFSTLLAVVYSSRTPPPTIEELQSALDTRHDRSK